MVGRRWGRPGACALGLIVTLAACDDTAWVGYRDTGVEQDREPSSSSSSSGADSTTWQAGRPGRCEAETYSGPKPNDLLGREEIPDAAAAFLFVDDDLIVYGPRHAGLSAKLCARCASGGTTVCLEDVELDAVAPRSSGFVALQRSDDPSLAGKRNVVEVAKDLRSVRVLAPEVEVSGRAFAVSEDFVFFGRSAKDETGAVAGGVVVARSTMTDEETIFADDSRSLPSWIGAASERLAWISTGTAEHGPALYAARLGLGGAPVKLAEGVVLAAIDEKAIYWVERSGDGAVLGVQTHTGTRRSVSGLPEGTFAIAADRGEVFALGPTALARAALGDTAFHPLVAMTDAVRNGALSLDEHHVYYEGTATLVRRDR